MLGGWSVGDGGIVGGSMSGREGFGGEMVDGGLDRPWAGEGACVM